jgi:hypothetical protein
LASPYNIFYGPQDVGDPIGILNYQLGTPFFGSLSVDFQITPTSVTTSPAPEPSTWLLMIAGIGGAGLMLRRARKGLQFQDAPTT